MAMHENHSSPVASLYLEADEPSFYSQRREKLSLQYAIRLAASPSNLDHEMISTVILPLPLIHSRRVVVSYKRKYVHELLVNRLFKPAQEKVWLCELTVPQ